MSTTRLVVLLGLSSCVVAALPLKRFLPNGEESRAVAKIPGQSPVAEGDETPPAAADLSANANIEQDGPMVLPGAQQGAGQSDLDAVGEGAAEADAALASDANNEQDIPTSEQEETSPEETKEEYTDDDEEEVEKVASEEKVVEKPIAGEKPLDQVGLEDSDNPTVPLSGGGGSGFDLSAIRAGLKCALFKDCSELMDDVDDDEHSVLKPTSIMRKTHR